MNSVRNCRRLLARMILMMTAPSKLCKEFARGWAHNISRSTVSWNELSQICISLMETMPCSWKTMWVFHLTTFPLIYCAQAKVLVMFAFVALFVWNIHELILTIDLNRCVFLRPFVLCWTIVEDQNTFPSDFCNPIRLGGTQLYHVTCLSCDQDYQEGGVCWNLGTLNLCGKLSRISLSMQSKWDSACHCLDFSWVNGRTSKFWCLTWQYVDSSRLFIMEKSLFMRHLTSVINFYKYRKDSDNPLFCV